MLVFVLVSVSFVIEYQYSQYLQVFFSWGRVEVGFIKQFDNSIAGEVACIMFLENHPIILPTRPLAWFLTTRGVLLIMILYNIVCIWYGCLEVQDLGFRTYRKHIQNIRVVSKKILEIQVRGKPGLIEQKLEKFHKIVSGSEPCGCTYM
jgi:hypothetical protein